MVMVPALFVPHEVITAKPKPIMTYTLADKGTYRVEVAYTIDRSQNVIGLCDKTTQEILGDVVSLTALRRQDRDWSIRRTFLSHGRYSSALIVEPHDFHRAVQKLLSL